ncbi:hypothetical protein AGDE_15201 [Angomonas deanei]|uniref:Uncharacterized protein n=1 Tax=Angomonas deanei TaxID=59799 RepID=A0A7G2C7J0_9TRYP|nr:hypothetical protein AGDE_15201 [Angomonas deanei]CAD2215768.1 hypothetical protein, conserved [Angomonas deanei]|eukprot:EPY19547.1 hypothetical protein AGDE_15201 [Angomonas deanei]
MWFIHKAALGLITSSSRGTSLIDTVHKGDRCEALLNRDGGVMTEEEAERETTWRTHHSFTAQFCLTEAQEGHAGVPATHVSSYDEWSADLTCEQTGGDGEDVDPHLLLSIAPYYVPFQGKVDRSGGDDRGGHQLVHVAPNEEEERRFLQSMLETPLIWEETGVLSLECNRRGLFVWSEEWKHYGRPLSASGFEKQGDANQYAANVHLHWKMGSTSKGQPEATLTVNRDATLHLPIPADWCESGIVFCVYVTLLERNQRVRIA